MEATVRVVAKSQPNKNKGNSKVVSSTTKRLAEYLELMEKENLQELEIQEGGFQVKLVRQGAGVVMQPGSLPQPLAPASPAESPKKEQFDGTPVKAPIAGILYRSASPSSPSFVSEGDTVTKGQVLCIIEAMKVMNEITAETGGRIKKILVENGKPIDADQVLFLLDVV